MNAARLLAARSARVHRRAWTAVFAALALTSVLLGAFALAVGSTALGHPRVERYAAAPLVVAGDQTTRYTAKPWGSDPETATAALTERVRVPARALDVVRAVPGVREAVPDRSFQASTGRASRPLPGRSWGAAALAPYALREGRAPRAAHEAVAGGGSGVRPGQRIAGQRIVGVADGPRALYVTEGEARQRAGRPYALDAIGVLPARGTDAGALRDRVQRALDRAGLRDVGAEGRGRAEGDSGALRVLTGDARGAAEHFHAAPARSGLLELEGAMSATFVLVALLVVSSLVAQALHQRMGELVLLRTVGATPRQFRAAVMGEVLRVAAPAALCGAVGSVPAFLALWWWLPRRGAVPDGLELPTPGWLFTLPLATAALTVGAASLAALLASVRTAKARPARAVQPPGKGRRTAGLVLLVLGAGSAGTAAAQRGETAAAAASGAAVTLVIGCALLGPWIAEAAMRLLHGPLRRAGGPGGWLAAANCTANSRRLGAVITPVVLVTAFVLVQLSAAATMRAQGGVQAGQALRADLAVTAPGDLSERALDRLRARTKGVTAATAVLPGTVVLARKETGEPRLERLPVHGVTPHGLSRVLDPDVTGGTLSGLRPGTVAVGADRARALGLAPGSIVRLRFGDGVERKLRVTAVYARSLALGDFLLSRAELARHTRESATTRILVATGGADAVGADAVGALTRALPGARVDRSPALEPPRAEDEAAGEALSTVAVAAIGAFAALAVLSTLSLVTAGRRGEFTLLRRVGAGCGQARRMLRFEMAVVAGCGLVLGTLVAALPLTAFSFAMARALPYVPPALAVTVVVAVAATVWAGTALPARRALGGQ
ncbi:FtsX-like permease family protein [Streptomyces sp. NPDC048172]|uniref:FtsX-like permease family protein n=1 Tax=Streptomyces sp. NPDC048172 TaxID=3365505 RepID=UPI0037204938